MGGIRKGQDTTGLARRFVKPHGVENKFATPNESYK
jgi:hypothetical protein